MEAPEFWVWWSGGDWFSNRTWPVFWVWWSPEASWPKESPGGLFSDAFGAPEIATAWATGLGWSSSKKVSSKTLITSRVLSITTPKLLEELLNDLLYIVIWWVTPASWIPTGCSFLLRLDWHVTYGCDVASAAPIWNIQSPERSVTSCFQGDSCYNNNET